MRPPVKFPFFIEPPDFRAEFEKEEKPRFYNKLTAGEQDEYNSSQVVHRTMMWSCMVAARAYNICIILCLITIVTGGANLWNIVQRVASGLLGIK